MAARPSARAHVSLRPIAGTRCSGRLHSSWFELPPPAICGTHERFNYDSIHGSCEQEGEAVAAFQYRAEATSSNGVSVRKTSTETKVFPFAFAFTYCVSGSADRELRQRTDFTPKLIYLALRNVDLR